MGPDSTARGFPWEGGAYQGGSREGSSVWDEKPSFLLKKTTVWRSHDWTEEFKCIHVHMDLTTFRSVLWNCYARNIIYWCVHSDEMKITCNQQTDRILQKNIVSQTYAACSPRAIMCFDRPWRVFFPFSCFSLIFAFESWFRFCAKRIQKLL